MRCGPTIRLRTMKSSSRIFWRSLFSENTFFKAEGQTQLKGESGHFKGTFCLIVIISYQLNVNHRAQSMEKRAKVFTLSRLMAAKWVPLFKLFFKLLNQLFIKNCKLLWKKATLAHINPLDQGSATGGSGATCGPSVPFLWLNVASTIN